MANNKLSATIQIDGIDYDVHAKTAEKVAKSLNIVHADGTASTFDGSTERTIVLNNFVKRSEMGAANGVATLNDAGKIPADQLPSYIDDVLEYSNYASFPQIAQEKGKIYVDTATNKTYRWSGNTYIEIGGGGGTGNGDMLKSVYAKNGATGIVDTAVNAEKLGGTAADAYAKKADLDYDKLINKPTIPTDTNQTVRADGKNFGANDVVEFVAGSNVTISATNRQITISATGGGAAVSVVNNLDSASATDDALSAAQGYVLNTSKQDKLVSGTNIKRINGNDILGSGDLIISGGGVNNATLTIQRNGSNVATFTANSSTDATANITVPTKTSELTNDSGFKKITVSQEAPTGGAEGDIWFKI